MKILIEHLFLFQRILDEASEKMSKITGAGTAGVSLKREENQWGVKVAKLNGPACVSICASVYIYSLSMETSNTQRRKWI